MSDLISRQAAIDMFQNLAYDDWNQGASTTWANAFAESAYRIKELPSAQPLVLTCDGCRNVGTYDTDFPCSVCIRREKDYYEQER